MALDDLWSDPVGVLIGLRRRLFGGADGVPRKGNDGHQVEVEANRLRYLPGRLAEFVAATPNHPQALIVLAEGQNQDQDWPALLVTGETLRTRFPNVARGYLFASLAQRRHGRFAEAEALARAAMRRFPRQPAAFEAYAFCASEQNDWVTAGQRWKLAARRFPDVVWPHLMVAMAATKAGQLDEADALLARAAAKWPNDWYVGSGFAESAERRGDWPEAVRRWRALRDKFSGRADAYAGEIRALRSAGALPQATALTTDAAFLFPRDAGVAAERAAVIAAGGDPGPAPEP